MYFISVLSVLKSQMDFEKLPKIAVELTKMRKHSFIQSANYEERKIIIVTINKWRSEEFYFTVIGKICSNSIIELNYL